IAMKSLDRDPQKRHPTAAAFADDLEKTARSIHALASVRDVAEYVQKVIGQEIAQQREVVRSWLAQSEPSRTELDDRDIIVGAPAATTSSSVSSAAISIPPHLGTSYPSPDLLSEIVRARRRRRGKVWGLVIAGAFLALGAWAVSKRDDLSVAIWGEHTPPLPAPTASAQELRPPSPAVPSGPSASTATAAS